MTPVTNDVQPKFLQSFCKKNSFLTKILKTLYNSSNTLLTGILCLHIMLSEV